jgi:hypothetical protein
LQSSGDYQPTNFSFDSTAFRAQEDMDLTTLAIVERDNTIVRSVTSTASTDSETSVIFKGLTYNFVVSPDTGRVWLDRNLGATAVCADADGDGVAGAGDEACYGDLYQWGRAADGHESRTSVLSTTQLTGISTASINFIINTGGSLYDWVDEADVANGITGVDESGALRAAAWGDGGANDICPIGFSVPTDAQLQADTIGASAVPLIDSVTAFSSFLKIPVAGNRNPINGAAQFAGRAGWLWSGSLESGRRGRNVSFYTTGNHDGNPRGYAFSVRCVGS